MNVKFHHKLCFQIHYESRCINLQHYFCFRQPKIVLQALNPAQMEQLQTKAKKMKLQSCLIHDAGRTEVESGTVTALALFGDEQKMNKVTSNLPLLK